MLSRVADSAYWMSRYLERAEHAARLGDVCLSLSLDRPSDAVRRLLPTVGLPPRAGRARAAHPGAPHAAVVAAPIDAIVACVSAARDNARQIREQISSEMWEQLNRLYLFVRQERRRRDSASTFDFFRAVKEGSHLFQGLTDATMTHGEGWHFIQIGRCLERAGATASLLDAHLDGGVGLGPGPQEIGTLVEWVGLLRSCAAFEAYCRCYTADIRPARVAEFLLLNAESPRSVRYAIDRVEVSLRAIAQHAGKTASGRVDRLAGRLQASLDFSQIDEILAVSLHRFVQDVRQQADLVHAALFETYISYPTESAIAS
jgi:uncharacterized alpha-E superfamily protein